MGNITESVRAFSSHSEYPCDLIALNEKGNPVYSFEFSGINGHWTCEHDLTTAPIDFELRLHPVKEPDQVVTVADGCLSYWGVLADQSAVTVRDRHHFLLTQSRFVDTIARFFDALDGYDLAPIDDRC